MMTRHGGAPDAGLIERALRLTRGFASWPPDLMGRLVLHCRMERHERGTVFYVAGAKEIEAFAVVSGHMVGWRVTPMGSRTVIAFMGPGTVIGVEWAFDREADLRFEISAHDTLMVVRMPALTVQALLDEHPPLWKDMALMALREHREIRETLFSNAVGILRQRVAATIERLARLYGSDASGTISLRVTQDDLAELLQVARQTVNKELKWLAAARVIEVEYNSLTVLDLDALTRMAANIQFEKLADATP
jgi:CRP-like cAMP-binding protein